MVPPPPTRLIKHTKQLLEENEEKLCIKVLQTLREMMTKDRGYGEKVPPVPPRTGRVPPRSHPEPARRGHPAGGPESRPSARHVAVLRAPPPPRRS